MQGCCPLSPSVIIVISNKHPPIPADIRGCCAPEKIPKRRLMHLGVFWDVLYNSVLSALKSIHVRFSWDREPRASPGGQENYGWTGEASSRQATRWKSYAPPARPFWPMGVHTRGSWFGWHPNSVACAGVAVGHGRAAPETALSRGPRCLQGRACPLRPPAHTFQTGPISQRGTSRPLTAKGPRPSWAQPGPPALTYCVALGKFLSLSEPFRARLSNPHQALPSTLCLPYSPFKPQGLPSGPSPSRRELSLSLTAGGMFTRNCPRSLSTSSVSFPSDFSISRRVSLRDRFSLDTPLI